MNRWYRFWEEFWYQVGKLAFLLWLRFCPDDKASYWLDWLPAFTDGKRYKNQYKLYVRGYRW